MLNREMYNWVSQECPTCGVPPTTFLGRRGGAAHRAGLGVECRVWRCDRCGLIFPNPMPIPLEGLEQHYAVDPEEYFVHHDVERKDSNGNQLLSQAESLIGGKGRLLDIGAGRGEILRAARMGGWKATGIEPSAKFADYASKHSGVEVLQKPLEDCSFDDDSFDAVILSAVLEHLYNPNEVLSKIARVLRPGGVLFLDVPNEAGLYFRVGNVYEKFRGRDWTVNLAPTFSPFHVFGFSPRSLRALLSKHGFQVTWWHIYPGASFVPAVGGLTGFLERYAAKLVTTVSRIGELGTYIETWAVKM